MAGRAFEYKGEVEPISVVHVWRVLAVVVGTSALTIVAGFVLPHDRPVEWSVVALGLGLVAILLSVLGGLALKLAHEGVKSTPPPAVAFTIALGFLVALIPFAIGLSGVTGLYRNLLFAPIIAVSTFGTRRMVIVFMVPTLAALAVAALAQGISPDVLPLLLITSGLVWGGVCAIVHLNHADTIIDLDHQKCRAELSTVVATAATLDHGLETMAPILGAFLDAHVVEIRRIGPDALERGDLVASWADGKRSAVEPPVEEMRTAVHKAGVIVAEDHVLLGAPAMAASEHGLVAVVTCKPGRLGARMTFVQRAEEARTTLATLVRRMELLDRLEARSTTDSLTDLANRRALFDRLMRELVAARREKRPLAVVMLDVDHFKDFNDTFGHLAGDSALVELARLFDGRLRATDLAARFGGEEFCLVLPRTGAAEAEAIVGDLHDGCRRIDITRPITFSAGIAEWQPDDAVDTLLGRADRALYAAKASGRNRSVVADHADHAAPVRPGT